MSETSASEPICAISSQLSPSLTNPSHQQKSHSKTFPTTPPIKCNTNSPPTRNKLALPSTGQDPYISYSSLSPTLITSVPPDHTTTQPMTCASSISGAPFEYATVHTEELPSVQHYTSIKRLRQDDHLCTVS